MKSNPLKYNFLTYFLLILLALKGGHFVYNQIIITSEEKSVCFDLEQDAEDDTDNEQEEQNELEEIESFVAFQNTVSFLNITFISKTYFLQKCSYREKHLEFSTPPPELA